MEKGTRGQKGGHQPQSINISATGRSRRGGVKFDDFGDCDCDFPTGAYQTCPTSSPTRAGVERREACAQHQLGCSTSATNSCGKQSTNIPNILQCRDQAVSSLLRRSTNRLLKQKLLDRSTRRSNSTAAHFGWTPRLTRHTLSCLGNRPSSGAPLVHLAHVQDRSTMLLCLQHSLRRHSAARGKHWRLSSLRSPRIL